MCVKENGIYFIDVLLQVTETIPSTDISVFGIVEDSQLITFTKRVDVMFASLDNSYMLYAMGGENVLHPNSLNIPVGVYKVSMIYKP